AILGFSPTSGPTGTTVTIVGTGFAAIPGNNSVEVDGSNASVISGTPTQLVVTVPQGAASGPINISNSSGSATSSVPFTVTAVGADSLVISTFTPSVAAVGATVTISGTGFDPNPANDVVT